jgi:hypothetical protein
MNNTDALRHIHLTAAEALVGLSKLGIVVRFVNFQKAVPLIVVTQANTNKLQGKTLGGGMNAKCSKQYLQLGAVYKGCHVQWRQYQPKKSCDCNSACVETLYCSLCNRSNLIKGTW